MTRCSCHGLQGCVPVAPSATPRGSTSARSCCRRSPRSAAASANEPQRPVRTSISDAISSPTRCGSSSVPRPASWSSSKRLTRPSVSGSRRANSSSTATVKSGTASNAARDRVSISSYPIRCSSPTGKAYLCARRVDQEGGGDNLPAPAPFHRAAGGETELTPALGGQCEDRRETLAQGRGVARGEREERGRLRPDLLADAGRHLGKAGVRRDDRQHAGRRRLGGDHPERLGEDRGHDGDVAERQQVPEVAVLERPGEERADRSKRLEPLAEIAEADDDGARVETRDRLEHDLDAFVLDQLPEVDDGGPPGGEETGEACGVALVGKPLLAVAGIRRVGPRPPQPRGPCPLPPPRAGIVPPDAPGEDLAAVRAAGDPPPHTPAVL